MMAIMNKMPDMTINPAPKITATCMPIKRFSDVFLITSAWAEKLPQPPIDNKIRPETKQKSELLINLIIISLHYIILLSDTQLYRQEFIHILKHLSGSSWRR